MAANMLQKRAKKAQRRKQVLAQKRTAEILETSLPARVGRAAQTPIRHCLLSQDLFDVGMGTLVVVRGATPDHLTLSSFLIDVYCLGVKDVMFEAVDGNYVTMYLDRMDLIAPLEPVDPADARKLLRDVVEWSRSIGFAPHRDFAAVEGIFGDVRADASEATYQFGRDGKPTYIPGPQDTAAVTRQRIAQLEKHLGDGAYEFALPV